jgi:hypothetical protein
MMGVIVEKIGMAYKILCTHNGFELPKFKLTSVLPLIFCRNWPKPVATAAEALRNLPPSKTTNNDRMAWSPRRTAVPAAQKVGSAMSLRSKRLDQTDLEMNIGN